MHQLPEAFAAREFRSEIFIVGENGTWEAQDASACLDLAETVRFELTDGANRRLFSRQVP